MGWPPCSSYLPGPTPAALLGEDKEYPSAPVRVVVGHPLSLRKDGVLERGEVSKMIEVHLATGETTVEYLTGKQ